MTDTSTSPAHPGRVAIVGAGHVGATFAYAMLLSGLSPEIVLVDKDRRRAEGEAMDLSHAVPFSDQTRIWAGDFDDCEGAAVVVLTAGAAQKEGETRLDLAQRNVAIFKDIVPRVAAAAPAAILVIATNPVDVLTQSALVMSGAPPGRVIGSGTILDTARFRFLLSEHFGVDARSVHAYIVGEHGDSEVAVWSLANIAGMRLTDFAAAHDVPADQATLDRIVADTRHAAYHVIERKGATYFAIASGLLRIVEAILRDQATVLSVSSLVSGLYGIDGVCLSLPSIVSRNGIERVLHLNFADDEVEALRRSAAILADTARSIGL